jgi:hypothetical protein
LFNIDVWLKKALENDLTPGPRLVASGREICGVGGLMDWNPDFRKIGMEGLVLLVNGPDEARAAVRKVVRCVALSVAVASTNCLSAACSAAWPAVETAEKVSIRLRSFRYCTP